VRREGPPDDPVGVWLLPLLAGAAALGGLVYFKVVPPRCRECRTRMVKLSEAGEDVHLEPAEQLEEKIGSVNYDLWLCNGCGQLVKRRWPNFFSSYGQCPHCRVRTKSTLSTVLRHADESRGGLVEVTESCVNCDYRSTYTRSTPRRTRSSYSSSSGFSSRSSSSSGGGTSSSGVGGGRSSGRGASGRW
jgi:uncharacterized protein